MLRDVNIWGVLLAFVPALINLIILVYLLRYMPREKRTDIFSLLVLVMILCQLEYTLFRLNISLESVRLIDKWLSFYWLLIGPLLLHFAGVFTGKRWVGTRWALLLIYAPAILFYTTYLTSPRPVPFSYDPFWGYTWGVREGSLDLVVRFWVIGVLLVTVMMLIHSAWKAQWGSKQRKQAILIAIGILIPTLQAGITQVLHLLLATPVIPLVATSMTFFSLATWIALKKYQLFDLSSLLDWKTVMSYIPNMVMAISPDKKIMYANSSAMKLVEGENGEDQVPLEVLFEKNEVFKAFCDHVFPLALSGKNTTDFEATFVQAQGGKMHVLLSAKPIIYQQKVLGVLLLANDISKRVEASEELKVSNDRYHLVTKATNEAIWDWRLTEGRMEWGVVYEELFGYGVDNGTSDFQHWENNIHDEDRAMVLESLHRHIDNNQSQRWQEEYRYKRKDGSYAHVVNKGYILRDEQGKAFRMVGAKQDITLLKEHIQKIEQQNKELNEIAWTQSHVVRAPLARMMGLVNYLNNFDLRDGERKKVLIDLSDSCEELDEVIREIVRKTEGLNRESV